MPSRVCPSQMVNIPRSGNPSRRCTETSIKSSESPMITSGITNGELTMPANRVRPGKRLKRVSASAARVPSTTEAQAVQKAILSDRAKPLMISASSASASYQRSDQPPQFVTIGLALKLRITSARMGR